MTEHSKRASELLVKLKLHEGEKISIQQILEGFESAGFSMLIIIFAIPVALPVPAVGYGTVMASPMLLLCIQLLFGFSHPKLPHFLGKRELKMEFFCKVVDKAVPILQKAEMLLKPRFLFLTSAIGERFIGLFCVVFCLSVMLPLPLTNTIPSMGIVLMAIGLMERDGLAILGGIFIGLVGMAITGVVLYFIFILGIKATEEGFTDQVKEFIKGLF